MVKEITCVSCFCEGGDINMVMGSLLIISACFLYWLLKPPVPQNPIFQIDVAFLKDSSLKGEAWQDV